MRTATRKHLSVVKGLAKFAQVTVGRADHLADQSTLPTPQIILSGHAIQSLSDGDCQVIEVTQRRIRETEFELGWQGAQHFLLKIEGLEVDGIDTEAACVAANQATRELIEN